MAEPGLLELCRAALKDACEKGDTEKDSEEVKLELYEDLPFSERLDQLIRDASHFPTPDVHSLLMLQASESLRGGDHLSAAITLLHAQGHFFRHKAMAQHSYRIQKRERQREESLRKMRREPVTNSCEDLFAEVESSAETKLDQDDDDIKAEKILKRSLIFQDMSSSGQKESMTKMAAMVAKLPEEWKMIQICDMPTFHSRFRRSPLDQPIRECNPSLILVSISGVSSASLENNMGFLACVARAPSPEKVSLLKSYMEEHADIVAVHKQLYKEQQPVAHEGGSQRHEIIVDLEERMKVLLDTIENRILGYAKLMLLGKPRNPDRLRLVTNKALELIKKHKLSSPECDGGQNFCLLFSLLDGATLLEREQVVEACLQVTSKKTVCKSLAKQILEFGARNPSGGVDRHPVVLILDKDVQGLPWESLEILKNQPCSRVPSIFFLCALYETHEKSKNSVAKMGVRTENVFYVLNPNKDLPKTQDRLEDCFKDMSLGEGVVGEWPSLPKMQSALSQMDAFMYCGHGSRMKNISNQEIEKLNVRALPLLFGCSSGRLQKIGRSFDPIGVAHTYLIATSPCLLGFLWSVTDQDLDRWTVKFLQHWLGDKEQGGERDFVRAVAEKRRDFKKLLNSTSTVVYGLPSFL